MTRLHPSEWERLLARRVPMRITGEVALVIAVIVAGITDEIDEAKRFGCEPFKAHPDVTRTLRYQGGKRGPRVVRSRRRLVDGLDESLLLWCSAIQLDPQFVLDVVRIAWASTVKRPRFKEAA